MSDVISYDPNEEIHNRSKQVRRQSHIKQLTKLHGKVEIHEIQAAFEAQEWQTMRSLLLRLQKPYQNKPKKGPPPKSPGRRDRGDVDQHAHLRAHRLPNLIPKSKRKKPGDSLASRRLRRQNPRGALQTLWIEILEILDQLGINRLSKIEKTLQRWLAEDQALNRLDYLITNQEYYPEENNTDVDAILSYLHKLHNLHNQSKKSKKKNQSNSAWRTWNNQFHMITALLKQPKLRNTTQTRLARILRKLREPSQEV